MMDPDITDIIPKETNQGRDEIPDMVWQQDTKIAQVFGKSIRDVINYVKKSGVPDEGIAVNNIVLSIGQVFIQQRPTEEQLLHVLESLSQPRMENLKKMAMGIAIRRCRQRAHAAQWLGISERSLRNMEKGKESCEA